MLGQTHAPAAITHSQCHALIELSAAGVLTVGELALRLNLDKSVVSRIAAQLRDRRLLRAQAPADDRRKKALTLSASGRRVVDKIHSTADAQVGAALRLLAPEQRRTVQEGLGLYARALHRARLHAQVSLRPITAADDPAVARIIETVMTEYGATGPGFAIDDPEVGSMSRSYDPRAKPASEYWVLDHDGEVIGGAGLGPLSAGDAATCELRKMYLLPRARGTGLGRRLLDHVLTRARACGYRRCYLETMATMHRARALYLTMGFSPLAAPEGQTGHFGCDTWFALDL